MAIEMPNRVVQIAARVSPGTPNQQADLFVPSSAAVLNANIRYQGYAGSLRAWSVISSISETFTPANDPRDSPLQRQNKLQQFRASPKKGLSVGLVDPGGTFYECFIADLYSVRPGFLMGLNEYFSGLELFGIQAGWKLRCKVIDRGWGLLEGDDYVVISGFVEERASFLQDESLNVYNFI